MSLFRRPLQEKLSSLLGTRVTFERLSVSLIAGTLDAHGVTVAGEDPAAPVLTIRRALAEVAITKALAGEVVVKSLTLERPIVTVVRRADGSTNLPRAAVGEVEEAATEIAEAAEEETPEAPDERGHARKPWRFDARKVLVVDGEAHLRDATLRGAGDDGYRVSAGPILAEVTHPPGADVIEFTLIVDSVLAGPEHAPAEMGAAKAVGRLSGVRDLSRAADAALSAGVELGEALRIRVESPALRSGSVRADVQGVLDLARVPAAAVAPLLPALVAGMLARAAPRGRVEVFGRAKYDPWGGLVVPELSVRATEIAMKVSPDGRSNERGLASGVADETAIRGT